MYSFLKQVHVDVSHNGNFQTVTLPMIASVRVKSLTRFQLQYPQKFAIYSFSSLIQCSI